MMINGDFNRSITISKCLSHIALKAVSTRKKIAVNYNKVSFKNFDSLNTTSESQSSYSGERSNPFFPSVNPRKKSSSFQEIVVYKEGPKLDDYGGYDMDPEYHTKRLETEFLTRIRTNNKPTSASSPIFLPKIYQKSYFAR